MKSLPIMGKLETMTKSKNKNGRPYKLSLDDHRDLVRRKRSGQSANELAGIFKIGLHTVYTYLNLDPEKRSDA